MGEGQRTSGSAVADTMQRCAVYGRHTFTSCRPQPMVPGLEWSLGLGVVHTGVEAGPGEMPPGGVGSLLPGFGSFNDNFSQQGNISWNKILGPTRVNTAAITVSRLAMHRFNENAYSNDIVSQLGIQGIGFGGNGAFGAPFFNVQGYSPMGDNYSATPMKAWDTIGEARDTFSWQHGRHSLKIGFELNRIEWDDYLASSALFGRELTIWLK